MYVRPPDRPRCVALFVVCGSRLGHKRKLVQLPHLITNLARMKRETEEHQYGLGLIWDLVSRIRSLYDHVGILGGLKSDRKEKIKSILIT